MRDRGLLPRGRVFWVFICIALAHTALLAHAGELGWDAPIGSRAPLSGAYAASCTPPPLPLRPFSLTQAVDRAICFNPKTREAWASVKQRAAQLSLAKAAFLPSVNAVLSDGIEHAAESSPASPEYAYNTRYKNPTGSLELVLTVFDFGLRSAQKISAQQALASAVAMREDALRTVFLQTVQAYYELLRTESTASADHQMETTARQISEVAAGRYAGGAAVLTEKLQAETAFSSATLKREKAEAERESARASLAVLLGLEAEDAVEIVPDGSGTPDTSVPDSVEHLVAEGLRNSPKLRAAYADLLAAQADLSAQKANNLPTITLNSTLDYRRQDFVGRSNIHAIDQTPTDNTTRDRSLALKISVPLLGPVTRKFQIELAAAKVENQEGKVEEVREQLSADIWNAYQKLVAGIRAVETTAALLAQASEFQDVATGRYYGGAGSLTDVLNAQSTLEDARLQRISALQELRVARLSLLTSLGRIGLADLQ